MRALLALHQNLCEGVVVLLLRLAVAVDAHRTRLPRVLKRWRGSLRRLLHDWLVRRQLAVPPPFARRHRPWNRTPAWREEQVVRLHVEQPQLGAGQLRLLAARVIGFRAARETFRQILARRRDLVTALQDGQRRRPRKIVVSARNHLWGADLTLVWLLGFLPVWTLGIVDYYGSRVLAFEPVMPCPTGAAVARCLEAAIARHGAPNRLLTDRGPVFRAPTSSAPSPRAASATYSPCLLIPGRMAGLSGSSAPSSKPLARSFGCSRAGARSSAFAAISCCGTTGTDHTARLRAELPTRSISAGHSKLALTAGLATSTACCDGTGSADDRRRVGSTPRRLAP